MKTTALALALSTLLIGHSFAAPPNVPAVQAARPQYRFSAYDGDPKKSDPTDMMFQVSPLDLRQPSEFLKLGEFIPGTKFKLSKFQFKTRIHPQYGEEDASELTLINTATNETVVLALPQIIHGVSKP